MDFISILISVFFFLRLMTTWIGGILNFMSEPNGELSKASYKVTMSGLWTILFTAIVTVIFCLFKM